ncbi:MAG TPA: hypothetical protein VF399_10955 [bacterium]
MTAYEILISLTTSFNICCVWFLSRSFATTGFPILRTLGCGALWERMGTFFGVRWKLVESALQQKAEVIFGLILLGLSSMGNFTLMFMNKTSSNNWILYLIISCIIVPIICAIGNFIVVAYLYYYFFLKAAKDSLYWQIARSKNITEDQKIWLGPNGMENLKKEIKNYHLDLFENRAIHKLKNYVIVISQNK